MRPFFRATTPALALIVLGPPEPAAAQIDGNEVVYVRQTPTNVFEMRKKHLLNGSDAKLFGGCPPGVPASICGYEQPAVSPDGHRLALVVAVTTESETCRSIWIAGIDGKNWRQVSVGCDARQPAWSPDSRWLVYESGNAIYQIELCNNQFPERSPRRVTSGRSPTYSPDGNWVAYASGGEIYKIRSRGSTVVNLTNSSTSEWDPRWTKPGSLAERIVFLSNAHGRGDIYNMAPDGSNVIRNTTTSSVKGRPDVGLLPALFVWQEGENVMLKTNAVKTLVAGRYPTLGGVAKKVRICP